MPSDFRIDRYNNTAPDFDDPFEVKLAWQRKLEAQRMNAELPSDLPHMDMNETRWWCVPIHPCPEQIKRQLKRYGER